MFTDPLFLTIVIGGGIFAVSYILGRNSTANYVAPEVVIESTIDNLVADGYIKHYIDQETGEVELLRWNEPYPD